MAALMTWMDRPDPAEAGRQSPEPGVDTSVRTSDRLVSPSSNMQPSASGNPLDTDPARAALAATEDPAETLPVGGISPLDTPNQSASGSSSSPQAVNTSPAPSEYRPIPIGEDHAQMFDKVAQVGPDTPSTVGELHEQLEQEEEDLSWAYDTEIRLAQYLTLHPSGQMFQIDNIECRSVVCQIQATGFDGSAVSTWGVVMDGMRNEPWANFVSTSTSAGSVGDKMIIITFLARNVP